LIFSFLWSSNREKKGAHLVNWERLAKPKHKGGWGIKNIDVFGIALAAKSLWRSLKVPCSWQEVVKAKYLKNKDVDEWFKTEQKNISLSLNCWKGIMSGIHIVNDCVGPKGYFGHFGQGDGLRRDNVVGWKPVVQ